MNKLELSFFMFFMDGKYFFLSEFNEIYIYYF